MTALVEGAPDPATADRLFDAGLVGPHVDEYRARARSLIAQQVLPCVAPAEERGLFPREVVRYLGDAGLIHERWRQWPHGDPGRGVVMAEELARAGCGGVGIGVSLAVETVPAALTRYGRSPLLLRTLSDVLDGRSLGCFAASEPLGGSDLNAVSTTATREGDGWRVRGEKKYVSLGRVADFALLLCRMESEHTRPEGVVPLGMVMVPADALSVVKPLVKLGTASLDTTWMACDAWVPDDAVLGRPGLGLAVCTWALSAERLAVAAGVVGLAERAIGLATAHLHRRRQFGRPLLDHQALRLRLAELASELIVLRHAVTGAAASLPLPQGCGPRECAALKVTAVRYGERVVSECMHLFGGAGYLEDETPFARMWRDVRLGRLGGGSDEMMWSLVAAGLVPDFDEYDATVVIER